VRLAWENCATTVGHHVKAVDAGRLVSQAYINLVASDPSIEAPLTAVELEEGICQGGGEVGDRSHPTLRLGLIGHQCIPDRSSGDPAQPGGFGFLAWLCFLAAQPGAFGFLGWLCFLAAQPGAFGFLGWLCFLAAQPGGFGFLGWLCFLAAQPGGFGFLGWLCFLAAQPGAFGFLG
jgi:hypothetical protein